MLEEPVDDLVLDPDEEGGGEALRLDLPGDVAELRIVVFDEFVNWLLLPGFSYLLTVSFPDWLRQDLQKEPIVPGVWVAVGRNPPLAQPSLGKTRHHAQTWPAAAG